MKFYILVIVAVAFLAYVSSEGCVQCNSRDDERCATDPSSILAKDCENGSSLCYARVQNGYTIRGCSNQLDNKTLQNCNNEFECQTCRFSDGCNRLVFPLHRAYCLQCSGNSTNSSCATDYNLNMKVCPIYHLGEKCYIRNTQRIAEGSFQRGCLNAAQAKKLCVKDGNCYTCEGRGCNLLKPDNPLIPIARDSAVTAVLSTALLLVSCLASFSRL